MPGSTAGTGQPITLRCAKCKTQDWRGPERGTHLIATGRFKSVKPGQRRGVRQTNRMIQYRCKDCQHVGWTRHIDAERLVARG